MNLRHTFQVSLYSLTALSSAMLAYGEETPFPSGLTVLLSVAAYFLNERQAKIRLGLVWANGLGLVALGLAGFEFFGSRIDARLLAGAHFLVYLTWIVLFADKRLRQYWWLFALSLLQVAVGSVMTMSGWYGMLLLAYLLLALWTMAIFHLYQGALRYGPAGDANRILEAGPLDDVAGASPSDREALTDGSASTLAALFAPTNDTRARNAVQQDVPDHWITPRFVGGVMGMSVAGLALGLALFLLVPRFWFGSSNVLTNRAGVSGRALTGFSTEVRLGHMGRILESNDRVLQVRLFDQQTDEPIALEEFAAMYGLNEPLFRGSVLDHYERGRWQASGSEARQTNMHSQPGPDDPDLIRQEYVMEAQGSAVLFAMRPLTFGKLYDPYDTLTFDPETHVISSRAEYRDPLEYGVYSARLRSGEGKKGLAGPFADMHLRGSIRRDRYLEFPTGLSRLKSLAEDWSNSVRASDGSTEPDELRVARAIESRLRDSGEFQYSLNMMVTDPEIDPVEDFLFNRKAGHCEYFASALSLMLRAVNVPSRLVTGFKGAEFFSSGGYYEVQQRHAHAWVEALVDGRWIVLDATPAAREESVRAIGSNAFWKSARNSIASLWSTYVLNMSRSRQKESLYDPLTGSMSGGIRSARGLIDELRNGINWLRELFVSPEKALSSSAVGVLLGLVVLPILAIRFALRWRRISSRRRMQLQQPWWVKLWKSLFGRWWNDPHGERFVVAFYERFVAAVSARGFAPEQSQTQREFARHVEQNLNGSLSRPELTGLPTEVAELYYRVRFGGGTLESDEGEQLDRRLTLFEECLAQT